MAEKTCCVTGHRTIPTDKLDYVERELRRELAEAIADGYTHFLSGFAEGADLLFAALVAEEKERHPELFLEAALPYAGRLKTKDKRFHELLRLCDGLKVESQIYEPSCYMERNRYMVDRCDALLAYLASPRGGTFYTVRYAEKRGKRVILLP